MPDWIGQALAAIGRRERLAMVSVVGARGSTPRELGARMLVWPEGFWGTIGGGALERQGLDQARRLLAQESRRFALQDYPLGPLLGQCCGGRVRLLIERLDSESVAWLDAAERASRAGTPFGLEAEFRDGALIRAVSAEPDPSAGADARTSIADVRRLSERICPARPRLVIFGAGHVGQAVARAFAPLPFDLDWLASREDLQPEAGERRATILAEAELEAAAAEAGPGAWFAVFTHSHDLDYRLTRAVLRRGDFRYLGLIGSATKRARFARRFRADGVTEDALARLTCPIGVPGLKSKAPAVIAVALAAQLLQLLEAEA